MDQNSADPDIRRRLGTLISEQIAQHTLKLDKHYWRRVCHHCRNEFDEKCWRSMKDCGKCFFLKANRKCWVQICDSAGPRLWNSLPLYQAYNYVTVSEGSNGCWSRFVTLFSNHFTYLLTYLHCRRCRSHAVLGCFTLLRVGLSRREVILSTSGVSAVNTHALAVLTCTPHNTLLIALLMQTIQDDDTVKCRGNEKRIGSYFTPLVFF